MLEIQRKSNANAIQEIDIQLENQQFTVEPIHGGLKTTSHLNPYILMSLFTDRRASQSGNETQPLKGGWYGDALNGRNFQTGSHLWQFRRAKLTEETLEAIRHTVSESLQWLIDDGLASDIYVTVEAQNETTAAIKIKIHAVGETLDFAWDWRN